MASFALSYYIIRKFLKGEPANGYTHQEMLEEMGKIFDEVSDKSVRTILNGLRDEGILYVKTDNRRKRYFIGRISQATDEDEIEFNDEFLFMAAVLSSLLNEMTLTDLSITSKGFQQQLAYLFANLNNRIEVAALSDKILVNAFGLKYLQVQNIPVILTLLRNCDKVVKLKLLGEEHRFIPNKAILRDMNLLICGIKLSTKEYCEYSPHEILSVTPESKAYSKPDVEPIEQEKLKLAHLTIGRPSGKQTDSILVQLSPEALKNVQNRSLPIDFELDHTNRLLYIEHSCDIALADWIIGLGTGVTVQEPEEMRDLVKQRLHEILSAYES